MCSDDGGLSNSFPKAIRIQELQVETHAQMEATAIRR